tara:strand:- start:1332 stop:1748 length:417 start_codon:yes stop_codon:yes gene_type:complete
MAQIKFPALVPSSRSFSPGSYPEAVFEAQNGAKSFIRYGNKPVNASLSLSFTNISDSDANSILTAYFDSESVSENYINISSEALAGIKSIVTDDSLSYRIGQYETGLRWRFSGPPEYSSVFPGVANVSCSFVACLDGD